MFTAVFFIIAKMYKQPKYPSTGERIKQDVHMRILECYTIWEQKGTKYRYMLQHR